MRKAAKIHVVKGFGLYNLRQMDRAFEEFRQAILIDPDLAVAHSGLGLVHFREGRLADAVRELETAKELDPEDAVVRTNLGVVYHKCGRTQDAIRELERATELDRDLGKAAKTLDLLRDLD